ncbi:hypothetical protein SAMN05660860_00410 [Geoalkalibacter ferrihydriticus]|uniref:Uncharacterized protein n=2 Tax=Geoalkalibacter ferrihydriticus TaxID=392333 RepID=A0A0C2HWC5_9BACT|nr:hypothetical protein [Geoalkalibacter ferrihydriticus]KIH77087.1 hypothetical protein GFER_08645 [Geoalkalibacter ferrihydriticus DSM 17813]SDL35217.1 hypothetical protein SAMN05660860_00410 [Geoalkalibacter ferrihydriticus]
MKLLRILFLLPAALLLMGMGDLGGAPQGAVPETGEDIRAVIVDRQGVRTEVDRFSMGGKTYLEGARGSGRMMVEFHKLAGIEFKEGLGDEVPVILNLRTGEKQELLVNKRAAFYGTTDFGTFMIRARDVRHIAFP